MAAEQSWQAVAVSLSPPGVGLGGRCMLLLLERPAAALVLRRPLPLCVDKRKDIKVSYFVDMVQ